MEFINYGFKRDSGVIEPHENGEGTKENSDERKRMEKYRVSDQQWKQIQDRLKSGYVNEKTAPERSNSSLSKYKVTEEQWENVAKHESSNGIDPGLPPMQRRLDRPSSAKTKNYEKLLLSRQTSEDSGYAKLDIMNERRLSMDNPEYEKTKRTPYYQHKDSSLQQKIQQRKEISQSIQSLEALQDLKPLTIPKDGDLHDFSVDEMSTFFRYMRIDEYIVQRLIEKNLDGVKFSKLKDTDLENIKIKNPIIVHFRNKSTKKRIPFML